MTHARNEDGFALIEVIVSAAVLALIALAVLSGIDGATASTARERARAIAASLAEQDQERMRGYRFDELAKIPQQPAQVIDGVTYTIESKSEWVVDDGEVSPTCGASGAKQSEYLRIVSTVKSKMVGTRIQEVKIESLVSPPVSGSLVVKLEGGVPSRIPAGITVSAIAKTGGRTYTAMTNAEGCAIFRTIETGDYTIRLNTPGWVDKKPAQLSEKSATVNSALVSVVNMSYDRAINMRINVKTLKPGDAFPSATTYDSKTTSVSDTAAEAGSKRTYTLGTAGSTLDANNQFPFAAAYSFFTGPCAIQSPVKTNNPNYFSATNPAATILGDPASIQKPQVATVFQPALNLRIRANYSNTNPNQSTFDATTMEVRAALQPVGTETCSEFPVQVLAAKNWPSTGWGSPPDGLSTRNWIVQSGTGFDPGLPFGTYKICIREGSRWFATAGTQANPHYDNTKPARVTVGTTLGTLQIPPSGTGTGAWSGTVPSGCSL